MGLRIEIARGRPALTGMWSTLLPAATVGASMLIGGLVLAHLYGVDGVTDAAVQANGWLLILAVFLGAAAQLLRARRVQRLLRSDRPVRLGDTYGAMVVGHGIGDLVPLIPGGPVLRSVLTQRLSGTPFSFSTGVFMLEGILDGLLPAGLIAYLLLVLPLPTWVRAVMTVALAQSIVLLVIPFLLPGGRRDGAEPRSGGGRLAALRRMSSQARNGLKSLTSRGPREAAHIVALSCAVTAVAAVQFAIFLRAFGLSTSLDHLLLLLVLTLASGSLPIKIPGSGTVATAAILPLAGLHGAGLAGFVLVSRLVLSSETVVLAGMTLVWWTVSRNESVGGIGDLFRLSRCVVAPRDVLSPVPAEA